MLAKHTFLNFTGKEKKVIKSINERIFHGISEIMQVLISKEFK